MTSTRQRLSLGTSIGFAVLLGCAPKPVPPPAAEPTTPSRGSDTTVVQPYCPKPYGTRTVRTRSNLRSEPSTESEIVAALDVGSAVGLLSLQNGWYSVLIDTTVGWVWAPLIEMNLNDRWEASISAARPNLQDNSLFVAIYRDDRQLVIILDIAWRELTTAQKERMVTRTGEVWRRATERMGITPAPEIRFMSNNDVEMAHWHAFWGTTVKY